jgi:hypothetical protein
MNPPTLVEAAQDDTPVNKLDAAIVEYMREVAGTPIVGDWYLVAELASEPNGGKQLHSAESPYMTEWMGGFRSGDENRRPVHSP